jgi:hypothetical protein
MSGIDLLITGLCSFVPKYPLVDGPQHQDNEMMVLLAESYKPLPGHSDHGQGHELHVPVLTCPAKYVVCEAEFRSPDLIFQPTPYRGNGDSTDPMAVFYLDDQHITVQPDVPNKFEVDFEEVEDCPGSKTSFRWVVPLAEVNPGSEKVKQGCLKPECDPSAISRLQLCAGKITTAKLATNRKRKVLLWRFVEINAHQEPMGSRAIAAVVGVSFDLNKRIVFTTELLKDHRPHRNRRVKAIFAKVKPKVLRICLEPVGDDNPRVWIKNTPWLDILQLQELRDPKRDDHFAHIYKLSEYPDKVKKKVPYTTGETCRASDDPRHGAGTDCPHARMQAIYLKPGYKSRETNKE